MEFWAVVTGNFSGAGEILAASAPNGRNMTGEVGLTTDVGKFVVMQHDIDAGIATYSETLLKICNFNRWFMRIDLHTLSQFAMKSRCLLRICKHYEH